MNEQRICLYCRGAFNAGRADQRYCDRKCKGLGSRTHNAREVAAPPELLLQQLRDPILANRPKEARGYLLHSAELGLTLPLLGPRRNGKQGRTDYFSLVPFEIPLIPLAGMYQVWWTYHDGSSQSAYPPLFVGAHWQDDVKRHRTIGPRLASYLRRKKQEARQLEAIAIESAANLSRGELPAPQDAATLPEWDGTSD
jgi:hypothetical protein